MWCNIILHYIAALDEKPFLFKSNIVQHLPALTDMHVPILA